MEASVVIEDTGKAGTETDFAGQAGARWTGTEFDEVRRFAASKAVTENVGLSDKDVGKSALIFTAIIAVCVASGLSLGLFFPQKRNDGSALCAHIAGNSDRLACYDRAAESAAAPFKGASPFSTFSRSDLGKSS
jgi:hypothetical protein